MTPNERFAGHVACPADVIAPSRAPDQTQTMDMETLREFLPTNVARIFISHKKEDSVIAKTLRDILKKFDSENMLEFYLSEEIPGGEEWYEWIRKNIRASNLLILIYTDPTRNWDWCLFEAGLFDDLDGICHRRITCLHSSKTAPPGPLAKFQSFAATHERIKEFVTQFLIGSEMLNLNRPVAKWLESFPDQLKNTINDICLLIDREAHRTRHYCKYLFIEVDEPEQSITSDAIPSTARVRSDNRSLDIFKKDYRDGLTWGEVEAKAAQIEDQRWMSELANAMKQVADGDIPDPIHAVFPSLLGDKTYRPILYRADRMVGGSIEYKILFHEDVTWRLKGVPNRIGTLLTLLVMATRFKYEVIDFFLNAYKKSNGERLDDGVFVGAYQSILNITSESKSRGNIDREALIYLFRDQEKTEVRNMLDQWTGMRDDLMQGLQQRDADTVKAYLENLAKANHAFINFGTKRYLEILEDV